MRGPIMALIDTETEETNDNPNGEDGPDEDAEAPAAEGARA